MEVAEGPFLNKSHLNSEVLASLGINEGRREKDDFFHNASFFNIDGRKIGWGDLSKDDIRNLTKELPEPLIILYEHDSYWNNVNWMEFPNSEGGNKTLRIVNRKAELNPGLDYVLQKAAAIIVSENSAGYQEGLYKLDDSFYVESQKGEIEQKSEDSFDYFKANGKGKWKLLGKILPEGIKSRVPKWMWPKLYPYRSLLQKARDAITPYKK